MRSAPTLPAGGGRVPVAKLSSRYRRRCGAGSVLGVHERTFAVEGRASSCSSAGGGRRSSCSTACRGAPTTWCRWPARWPGTAAWWRRPARPRRQRPLGRSPWPAPPTSGGAGGAARHRAPGGAGPLLRRAGRRGVGGATPGVLRSCAARRSASRLCRLRRARPLLPLHRPRRSPRRLRRRAGRGAVAGAARIRLVRRHGRAGRLDPPLGRGCSAARGRPRPSCRRLPPLAALDLARVAARVGCRRWCSGATATHAAGRRAAAGRGAAGEPAVLPGVGHMPMIEVPYASAWRSPIPVR